MLFSIASTEANKVRIYNFDTQRRTELVYLDAVNQRDIVLLPDGRSVEMETFLKYSIPGKSGYRSFECRGVGFTWDAGASHSVVTLARDSDRAPIAKFKRRMFKKPSLVLLDANVLNDGELMELIVVTMVIVWRGYWDMRDYLSTVIDEVIWRVLL
ncbi:hypothetical protein EXIGLDRAFT_732006 [Exidia glandulosa HHB12029]|uniref:DUF6593 domain-containing protein n=1 Tax=Exidia glandulosa HHB12029 TaxID=1314781 RepID=A0A165KUW6_EXIGL|nr:hypothetical protein EXIGLDRAFT_732006 [Exidia glandulosa HHB12029]